MKNNLVYSILFIFVVLIFTGCGDNKIENGEMKNNVLTNQEVQDGWQLLFDGKTTNGWHKFNEKSIDGSWIAQNGELIALGKGADIGGDIVSDNEYENFDLRLEWKISSGGNSGIFYGVVEGQKYKALYYTGPEYQLIDDIGFPDKLEDWQKAGADYAMYLPSSDKKLKPIGEWNSSRILVVDSLVQLYLNGEKIIEFKRWTDDWYKRKLEGKWKEYEDYGMNKKGKIGLQDHGNKIWFRNIKIKTILNGN